MRQEMRWGGLAGFGTVALAVIARVILGSPPAVTDPPEQIAAYLATHRNQITLAALLLAIAIMLALWLGVTLAALFRRADHNSVLPMIILAGFAVTAATGLFAVTMFAGMAYAVSTHPPLQAVIAGPYTAVTVAATIAGVAGVLPLAAVGLAIWGTGSLPAWLAWLSWLAAALRLMVAAVVASGALMPGNVVIMGVAGAVGVVWLLSASWLLVRRRHDPAAGA